MKKKFVILITTVCVAAVAAAVGITLAVVGTDNPSSGRLSTADLSLTARASNIKVYSAAEVPSDVPGAFRDEKGRYYVYEQSIVQGDLNKIGFSRHEGTVEFSDNNVDINGMMPGDKVEFDIVVTSDSTIAFNYRAELRVDADAGADLLNALEFGFGSLGALRNDISDENTVVAPDGTTEAVLSDYTEWTTFGGNQESIEHIHAEIALPMTANIGEGQTVKFSYIAKGVQNAEERADMAEVTVGGETERFKNLSGAVAFAAENGADEVRVIGSTVLEEGTVSITSAMHIVGVADSDGKYPTLKGARISIEDGAAVAFEHLNFAGAGYIDITDCTALTLDSCESTVAAPKFFDVATRTYLPDPAFIVSGESLTPDRLVLTHNTIIPDGAAAVCMRSRLRDGSSIEHNVFGSADKAYGGTAVIAVGGADSDATVNFVSNTVYGKLPLSLGDGGRMGRFEFVSSDNTALSAGNMFVTGSVNAAFTDSGSELNGAALTLAGVSHAGLLFGAVDVQYDESQRIVSAKVALSDRIQVGDFYINYVAAGEIAHNAIALYRNGQLYGYLYGADNQEGYTVENI